MKATSRGGPTGGTCKQAGLLVCVQAANAVFWLAVCTWEAESCCQWQANHKQRMTPPLIKRGHPPNLVCEATPGRLSRPLGGTHV